MTDLQEDNEKMTNVQDNVEDTVDEKNLSILGLKGAGKSTFMAVLQWALSDRDFPSKWTITPEVDDNEDDEKPSTNDLIFELENWIFTKKLYPPRTDDVNQMNFTAKKNREWGGLIPGGKFRIRAGDVPGDAVMGRRSEFERYYKFYEKYIDDVSAVIFLIDPAEKWKEGTNEEVNYFPLLRSILTELKRQNEDVHVAFGITKVDDLPKDRLDGKLFDNIYTCAINQDYTRAEELAAAILGERTIDWIEHNFEKHVSWWLISATGFIEEKGKKTTQFLLRETSQGQQSGIKDPDNIKPIGVVEIVEWALDRLAKISEKKRPLVTGKLGKGIEELAQNIRDRLTGK